MFSRFCVVVPVEQCGAARDAHWSVQGRTSASCSVAPVPHSPRSLWQVLLVAHFVADQTKSGQLTADDVGGKGG